MGETVFATHAPKDIPILDARRRQAAADARHDHRKNAKAQNAKHRGFGE
jgi:hypothetical protein